MKKTLDSITPTLDIPTNRKKLVSVLDSHGVKWQNWDSGDIRRLDEFIDYLNNHQTWLSLHTGFPVFHVRLVRIIVQYLDGDRLLELKEDRQIIRNTGVTKRRDFRGLGETLRIGELPWECAYRGLAEELSFRDPSKYELNWIRFEDDNPLPSEKYPGLTAVYHRHVFRCLISAELYEPRGYVEFENHGDAIREIHFVWIDGSAV